MLLTSRDSILEIALGCGFQSHEVFTRTFRRHFGLAPSTYRSRGFSTRVSDSQAGHHALLVHHIGACVGLYHLDGEYKSEWLKTSGDTRVLVETLPGGLVATTTHQGPYATLPDAYAALQQWIGAHGLSAAGPPWECYLTDPREYPDPKDWKTDVFWPVKYAYRREEEGRILKSDKSCITDDCRSEIIPDPKSEISDWTAVS